MNSNKKILIWPHFILQKKSNDVFFVNKETHKVIDNMIEIMKCIKNAAGIAAPQVGNNLNIITITFKHTINKESNSHNDALIIIINPRILKSYGQIRSKEECLSIPHESGVVERKKYILASYVNTSGFSNSLTAGGFISVCMQHEIDHLIGKLWIDYQSPAKKMIIQKKMLRLQNELFFDKYRH